MNALLEQFVLESREGLEQISNCILALEQQPDDHAIINDLFRHVHTLKGNSGLFDFKELTQVVHAAEDLLDRVRDNSVPYSGKIADQLLEALDFLSQLLDGIEHTGALPPGHGDAAQHLSKALRALIPGATVAPSAPYPANPGPRAVPAPEPAFDIAWITQIPEPARLSAIRRSLESDQDLQLIRYVPEPECFFKGEDPLFHVSRIPGLAGLVISTQEPWPTLVELDIYRSNLVFHAVSTASASELEEHFRYVPEQATWFSVPYYMLMQPQGTPNQDLLYQDFVRDVQAKLSTGDWEGMRRSIATLQAIISPSLWVSSVLRHMALELDRPSPSQEVFKELLKAVMQQVTLDWRAMQAPISPPRTGEANVSRSSLFSEAEDQAFRRLWEAQVRVLELSPAPFHCDGRLEGIAATLTNLLHCRGERSMLDQLAAALEQTRTTENYAPLIDFLKKASEVINSKTGDTTSTPSTQTPGGNNQLSSPATLGAKADGTAMQQSSDSGSQRRVEDNTGDKGTRVLRVSQEKVERLMDLIGEMIVAKNALPYLAKKAEEVFGSREMARELKAQYAVINRIAEEMQDAIMQVRMLPVSNITQRFPRLVRDISRKLGKKVNLVIEGDDTEADKHVIESLADPLIHIVRNSLDHGIEMPDVRTQAGKSAEGTIRIKAYQESDRVFIEIHDDGKGINPGFIKQKAYAKGLIDEAKLESMSDQEAIQLIFAPGFSTVEQISDLSGRGVGMDVVRSAVEQVHGSVQLSSTQGQGTQLKLSLPLSIAVSNVMMIESAGQVFGIPMDLVVETVRVPQTNVRRVKQQQTTVLRERLVPLYNLNSLLALNTPQILNEEDEFAVLVVRHLGENVGIIVDDFQATLDIVLKPMEGVLAGTPGYAGTALLGDGSVLMVLNPKELL